MPRYSINGTETGGGSSVTIADITDAGATGAALLATATAAAARGVLDTVAAPGRSTLYMVGTGMTGTTVGAAPHWYDGASLVLMLWPISVTGDVRLMCVRNGSTAHIRVGDSADKGLFNLYCLGGFRGLPADCTLTGNLGAPHVLAISCTGGNFRTSWDGGTVGVTSCGGTPSAPGASNFGFGSDVNGNYSPDVEYLAARSYSTVLSDADLIAAGSSAGRTAGRIPTLTGTVSWEMSARDLAAKGSVCMEHRHAAVDLVAITTIKRLRER